MDDNEADLIRLKSIWGGTYSITCLDGVWSAYFIRTGEELSAPTLRKLRSLLREDFERRIELLPGAPERMST
jgi:hypothetical protein